MRFRYARLRPTTFATGAGLVFLAGCGLTVSMTTVAGSSDLVNERIAILKSEGAEGTIDRNRLTTILQLSCQYLQVAEADAPKIMILHASPASAALGGVSTNEPVMAERAGKETKEAEASALYTIWIVGRPDDDKLVTGMVTVLKGHFHLDLSPQQVVEVERLICLRMRDTVNAHMLAKGKR